MRCDVLQMCTSYYYIFQQSELYFLIQYTSSNLREVTIDQPLFRRVGKIAKKDYYLFLFFIIFIYLFIYSVCIQSVFHQSVYVYHGIFTVDFFIMLCC